MANSEIVFEHVRGVVQKRVARMPGGAEQMRGQRGLGMLTGQIWT